MATMEPKFIEQEKLRSTVITANEPSNTRPDIIENQVIQTKIAEFPPEITQTTSESQKTQSKFPKENVCQHLEPIKLVADQVNGVELIEDHHKDEAAQESGYKIDKLTIKKQEVPDSKMISDNEILEESTDGSGYAEDCTEEDTLMITEDESADGHSLIPEPPAKHSKMSDQELLESHGLILTKMYKHFLDTEEYYNNLRVNTLACLKLYRELKNKIEKGNMTESCPIPTSSVEAARVAQEPAPEKNSNGKQKKNVDSSVVEPRKNKKTFTYVLPPEFDPNDSTWTLKYRGPGQGLIELIPQSHVYVKKKEFNKCIRSSNNCRTLARTLLRAVFSKNALSVCSLTGAKARAFGTMNIDTRPGLDTNARMVLLAFIEDYGNKRDWNTSDTAGIISSIRTKMQQMRNRYRQR